MSSKLQNLIKSEFKKANAKSFLFFLIFSSLIWLIVQFSQQYTEILDIPIVYENFPQDKLIEEKENHLEIRVQQTGFQLAWLKVFKPEVTINLDELPSDSTYLKYNLLENHYDLVKDIPIDLNKAEFLEKEIRIPFHMKDTKKVPIISKIDITYAPGYSSEEKLILMTDSVQISGTQAHIDSVSKVYTKPLKLENVDSDLLEEVQLEQPENVVLYQSEIYFKLDVEKFTEKQMKIPVEVVNAPPNMEVSLYPAEVTVNFKVNLDKYQQIGQLDFLIVCDYKDLENNSEFFIPKVEEQPDFIQNLRLSPRTIDYIIKK